MRCEKCNLTWDMNDLDPPQCRKDDVPPPPFARVRCGGACEPALQGLTEQQYEQQLMAADRPWRCPSCGCGAHFDDEYFEERHGIEQGVHPEEETRNNLSADANEYRIDVGALYGSNVEIDVRTHGNQDEPPAHRPATEYEHHKGCPECEAEERDTRSAKGREIAAKTAAILGVVPKEALRCNGVGRAPGYDKDPQAARVLEVYFSRELTDAEMRHFHELIKNNTPRH